MRNLGSHPLCAGGFDRSCTYDGLFMKKILITGISGFVGGYVVEHLTSCDDTIEIHGISRSKPAWDFVTVSPELLDGHHFHLADLG